MLLGVQAVALSGLGVADLVATVVGQPADRALSYTIAGFALGTAGVLALLARAVARRRSWARSPAVVLQLLALPVGVGLAQGGVWPAAAPVLLLSAAGLWQLLAAGPALRSD